ncbi:MAG: flagellin, partial [Pseudomonadota bacterium]|nr:flagellin [Pseudomonadota bacterium]
MPVIASNLSSLYGLMYLKRSENQLEIASQRLSSGKKLNSAADDAAGLAIATRMTSQIRGLNMAIKNSNDGISMASTTESALVEISNMLQRMRELAVQSGNDINSGKDRGYLQDEINQLKTEITSISTNTEFNGSNVLDGTLSSKVIQTGMNSGQSITFSVDNVAASVLGSYTYTGTARATLAAAAAPAANSTTADA